MDCSTVPVLRSSNKTQIDLRKASIMALPRFGASSCAPKRPASSAPGYAMQVTCLLSLLFLCTWLCGCQDNKAHETFGHSPQPSAGEGLQKIKHIVFLIKENRSFDTYFGTFPGADGATLGRTSHGKVVQLSRTSGPNAL